MALQQSRTAAIPEFRRAANPDCAFAGSPFFVKPSRVAWQAGDHCPAAPVCSSLGVGGTNAHVILEEAPPRCASGPSRKTQLLLCSARSDNALRNNAAALAQHFMAESGSACPMPLSRSALDASI